jgi:drug/metabolite transporter (DMT)-like permease
MGLHGHATRVLSVALVIIGVVMVVRTIVDGGGPQAGGLILGILFALAGAGRLYAQRGGPSS